MFNLKFLPDLIQHDHKPTSRGTPAFRFKRQTKASWPQQKKTRQLLFFKRQRHKQKVSNIQLTKISFLPRPQTCCHSSVVTTVEGCLWESPGKDEMFKPSHCTVCNLCVSENIYCIYQVFVGCFDCDRERERNIIYTRYRNIQLYWLYEQSPRPLASLNGQAWDGRRFSFCPSSLLKLWCCLTGSSKIFGKPYPSWDESHNQASMSRLDCSQLEWGLVDAQTQCAYLDTAKSQAKISVLTLVMRWVHFSCLASLRRRVKSLFFGK